MRRRSSGAGQVQQDGGRRLRSAKARSSASSGRPAVDSPARSSAGPPRRPTPASGRVTSGIAGVALGARPGAARRRRRWSPSAAASAPPRSGSAASRPGCAVRAPGPASRGPGRRVPPGRGWRRTRPRRSTRRWRWRAPPTSVGQLVDQRRRLVPAPLQRPAERAPCASIVQCSRWKPLRRAASSAAATSSLVVRRRRRPRSARGTSRRAVPAAGRTSRTCMSQLPVGRVHEGLGGGQQPAEVAVEPGAHRLGRVARWSGVCPLAVRAGAAESRASEPQPVALLADGVGEVLGGPAQAGQLAGAGRTRAIACRSSRPARSPAW